MVIFQVTILRSPDVGAGVLVGEFVTSSVPELAGKPGGRQARGGLKGLDRPRPSFRFLVLEALGKHGESDRLRFRPPQHRVSTANC